MTDRSVQAFSINLIQRCRLTIAGTIAHGSTICKYYCVWFFPTGPLQSQLIPWVRMLASPAEQEPGHGRSTGTQKPLPLESMALVKSPVQIEQAVRQRDQPVAIFQLCKESSWEAGEPAGGPGDGAGRGGHRVGVRQAGTRAGLGNRTFRATSRRILPAPAGFRPAIARPGCLCRFSIAPTSGRQ